ncbi:MAG TPA: CopD family protein [Gammaproteobacteria bacterium]|nr:CopD family protein [Gammaproteobacteria bacterium]
MPVIAITAHVLAVIIWIGGMFFGFVALRPAMRGMDTLAAARFWCTALGRFLPWVWAAIVVLLASGTYMVFNSFDGFAQLPWFVQFMMGIGIFMMMLVAHLTFSAFKKLKRAVAADDAALAAKALRQIRIIMDVNLILGLLIVVVVMMGAYVTTE